MSSKFIKKKQVFLLGIIILALALRVWQIGKVPLAPDWDEVALAYNAYSILHTGRDEYGQFLPIVLRSFADYKPALYSYFAIPSIAMLGLTTIAVRLPAVLIGVLAVFATYLFIKELTARDDLALVSAFFLAISPWHIQFSRVAFEASIGMAFNIFTVLFFLKGLKKPYFLLLAVTFAALNLYTYQSEKVFVPLFCFLLIFLFWQQLLQLPRKILGAALVLGILLALPMLIFLTTNKDAFARVRSTSVFANHELITIRHAQRIAYDEAHHLVLPRLIDSPKVIYLQAAIGGFLSHLDLNWLFITGDIERHHAPYMGLLYLWELPFLLLGLYMFFTTKTIPMKTKWLLGMWFLLAPLPASITTDVPHAVRTMNFLPTFQVFTAFGILTCYILIEKKYKKRKVVRFGMYLSVLGFCLLNFAYYLNQYFVQQNYFFGRYWQYGYEELVGYIQQEKKSVAKVIISDTTPLDQSYIFFLFYQKYDPEKYQREVKYGTGFSRKFDQYEFRQIKWNEDQQLKNVLLVGSEKEIPQNSHLIKTITNPDGSVAMRIIRTDP